MSPRLDRRAALLALGFGGCAACAASLAVALVMGPSACIPDLPPSEVASNDAAPPGDAAVEADPPPAPGCGDGIVQLSRGEQCDPGPSVADAAPNVGCAEGCRVACNGGFHWAQNDHCYFLLTPDPQNIQEAITRCRGYGSTAHVATFASHDELAAVLTALHAATFWGGLTYTPFNGANNFNSLTTFEPGWQSGCPGCFAETAGPVIPGADAGNGCVAVGANADAAWQQIPCSTAPKREYALVCEWEPTGRLSETCEAGACFDLRATYGAKHYVFRELTASADEAAQQCASLGGTLVVPQTSHEREQLWKEVAHITGDVTSQLWFGLSMREGGTDWTWADDAGADAYASEWGIRQPRDGGAHAYAQHVHTVEPDVPPVDDTLLLVETTRVFAYPVCQLPVAATTDASAD